MSQGATANAAAGGEEWSDAAAESKLSQAQKSAKSRMMAAYGAGTIGKILEMKVLVVGLRGAGFEVAKNLALTGCKSIALFDRAPIEAADLGRNTFYTEADIGQPRDAVMATRLCEINDIVSVHEGELAPDQVAGHYSVVVFTDSSLPAATIEAIDSACRESTPVTGVVVAEVRGVTGRIFVDFGPAHTIQDANGKDPPTGYIETLDKGEQTVMTLVMKGKGNRGHGFQTGDYVTFRSVAGMAELNAFNSKATAVRVVATSSASITVDVDSRAFGEFVSGEGTVRGVKMPKTQAFESFAAQRLNPTMQDPMQFGLFDTRQLHLAYEAIEAFKASHDGVMPALRSAADLAAVQELAAGLLGAEGRNTPEAVDADTLRCTVTACQAEMAPICAFIGGVAAQEVIKFTGKYTPIQQMLYFADWDVLAEPKEADDHGPAMAEEDFAPTGDRYQDLAVLVGRQNLARIHEQRCFLVGAGALGCEYIKTMAQLGVGSAGAGKVTVTDMDNIEVSNLSRQFLFRSADVGKPKSVCAAARCAQMNPAVKLESLMDPVGPATEHVFSQSFWRDLDIVVNALDNVKARQYTDQQCVAHSLPLMESGTHAVAGNTQAIIPFETASYNDIREAEQESTQSCTIKFLPYEATHCIQWARDEFNGRFVTAFQDAAACQADPAAFIAKVQQAAREEKGTTALRLVGNALQAARIVAGGDYVSCVREARLAFDKYFYEMVRKLTDSFPRDYVGSNGSPFWTAPKRFPTAAEFSLDNELHAQFVAETAALLAIGAGVYVPATYASRPVLEAALSGFEVPEYKSGKLDSKGAAGGGGGGDDEVKENEAALASRASALVPELQALLESNAEAFAAAKFAPAEFEKDDDENHHIDWITAASNNRCVCYTIEPSTRSFVHVKAGNIIPAVATTTCAITGLIGVEFVKCVMLSKPGHRDINLNLAINYLLFMEPESTRRTRTKKFDEPDPVTYSMGFVAVPDGFCTWDRMDWRPTTADATFADLEAWWTEQTAATDVTLVNLVRDSKEPEKRRLLGADKGQTILAAAAAKFGEEVVKSSYQLFVPLEVLGGDAEGCDVLSPVVHMWLPGAGAAAGGGAD